MEWKPIEAKDILVGHAVRFKIWCTRRYPDGKPMYRPTEPGQKPRMLQVPVVMTGRVVDTGRDEDGRNALGIERTNVGTHEDDVELPSILDYLARNDLRDVHRLEDGRLHRNDYQGKLYLRDLLAAAAGGDEKSAEAVERVAACVTGRDISAASRSGTLPYRVGRERAWMMLSGDRVFSEYVLRQLDGRMPIPEARDGVWSPVGNQILAD